MNYPEISEIDTDLKIKKEADELYASFFSNVQIRFSFYQLETKRFLVYEKELTKVFIKVTEEGIVFQFRRGQNHYDVKITKIDLFELIKKNYPGIDHLKTFVRSGYVL